MRFRIDVSIRCRVELQQLVGGDRRRGGRRHRAKEGDWSSTMIPIYLQTCKSNIYLSPQVHLLTKVTIVIGGKLLLPLCLLLLCYSTPAINTQGLLPCHEEHVVAAVVIICESNSLRYQTPTCDCLNVNQWSSQIGSNGRIRKDQVECNRQQRRRRRSNKLSSNYSCSETKTNHRNNKTCSFYKYGRPSSLVGRS